MKNKVTIIIITVLIAILLAACGTNNTKKQPYSMKLGTYDFERATLTNLITHEVTDKDFDTIFNDKILLKEWGFMFGFSVGINDNTEFIYKNDGRCFVLNEGLAYEIIDKDQLKLHLPRWRAYDYGIYDIVIFLSWQQSY